jgi:ketosteroid isomerase-like protein
MKRCLRCGHQFPDDDSFCLEDGSILTVINSSQDAPTQVITSPFVGASQAQSAPSHWIYVLVGCLATGLAVSVYFLAARGNSESPPSVSTVSEMMQAPATPSPVPSKAAIQIDDRGVQVDTAAITNEIREAVRKWIQAAEARDIDATMSFYSDTVDYYVYPRSSKYFVKRDKQKAFDKYQSLSFSIADLTITPGSEGITADAVFEKTWVFQGATVFSGRDRQLLKFRKIDGQWLIYDERELKIYYVKK